MDPKRSSSTCLYTTSKFVDDLRLAEYTSMHASVIGSFLRNCVNALQAATEGR